MKFTIRLCLQIMANPIGGTWPCQQENVGKVRLQQAYIVLETELVYLTSVHQIIIMHEVVSVLLYIFSLLKQLY